MQVGSIFYFCNRMMDVMRNYSVIGLYKKNYAHNVLYGFLINFYNIITIFEFVDIKSARLIYLLLLIYAGHILSLAVN